MGGHEVELGSQYGLVCLSSRDSSLNAYADFVLRLPTQ